MAFTIPTKYDIENKIFLRRMGLTEKDILNITLGEDSDNDSDDAKEEKKSKKDQKIEEAINEASDALTELFSVIFASMNQKEEPTKHEKVPELPVVVDAVVDESGKAIPLDDSKKVERTDPDIIFPKLLNDDQYKDILDREETKFSQVPWFVTRGIASGILYAAGKIGLNQMLGEIQISTMNHPETAMQFQMDNLKVNIQDIINAITGEFAELGCVFAGVPRMKIEEVCSKQMLDQISTDVENGTDSDRAVKKIVEKIHRYQYRAPATGNTEKPIDPVVTNQNTVKSEANSITFKNIDDAFGDILKNKKHSYAQFGNYVGLYIDGLVDKNGQPTVFLIDPNIIIGNGYNILGNTIATGTCLINIRNNKDIVKKIIDNPAYILTDAEYKQIKRGQFINEELYAILDMSGTSKYLKRLDPKQFSQLEEKLNKIFGTPNVIFGGLQFIPRFRFMIFKSINNFTLVSDSKVKAQADFLKQTIYPIMPNESSVAIQVLKNEYTILYKGSNIVMKF